MQLCKGDSTANLVDARVEQKCWFSSTIPTNTWQIQGDLKNDGLAVPISGLILPLKNTATEGICRTRGVGK